ncbi:MAG: hypothetical protein KA731_03335 [Candidatus Moranbacteria bacterium]|nr:hypothetical protein [Candidatus Moranbacteria bacterium]
MQGKLRVMLFLLFVASFLAASGSVLFYAFGYRFNFERGIFVYGGSITLKSNPVEISVRIDDALIPSGELDQLNQSYHITGIIPGEHLIEVSAPGYQSWRKRVIVRSGVSNEFWNITLPRQSYDAEHYAGTDGFTRYFQSPEPTVFAGIRESSDMAEIMMRDTEAEANETLFARSETRFDLASHENLEWSPAGDQIVFPVFFDHARHVMTVDIETRESRDLSQELSHFSMLRPRWNPEIKRSLLYLADGNLYRLDLALPETTPLVPMLLASDIVTYDLSGSDIYLYRKDGTLSFFDAGSETPEPRVITSIPGAADYQEDSTLIVYDEYRIALISSDGALLFFNDSLEETSIKTLAAKDVSGVQFSDDGKKLLFFSDRDISVYFIQEWEVQPKRMQEDIWQISRFADSISSVQWAKDYEHVLYLKHATVYAAELDNRDQRNIHTLISFDRPPLQILSRVNENQVFFVSNDGDIPSLLSIDFPEFKGFFTR